MQTIRLDRCPLCKSAAIVPEISSGDFETHSGPCSVDACRECGVRFTNPRPGDEVIPSLYATRSTADFPNETRTVSMFRKYRLNRLIRRLVHQVPKNNIRVLDYGCGDGAFALQCAATAAVSSVTACDFHPNPPSMLNHAPVTYRSHQEFAENRGTFDLVAACHILEHAPDPSRMLAALSDRLTDDGILYVEVPNYHTVWRSVFGKFYFGWYLPRHLFHFTRHSLAWLARGLRVRSLGGSHTPVLGKSIAYVSGLPLTNTGLVGLMLFPLQIICDAAAGGSTVLSMVCSKQ